MRPIYQKRLYRHSPTVVMHHDNGYNKPMRIKGKRVALFAENLYQDLELWFPFYRLREEGAEVMIIGSGSSPTYHGKYGYPVTVDASIDRVNADTFDAVVIPGGFAPDYMRRSPAMIAFVKTMHENGKIVAAICHGGWMLASAEIIEGKTVTGFFAIKDDLRHAGAHVVDKEVVRDGTIITSRNPDDLPAFCATIIEALE